MNICGNFGVDPSSILQKNLKMCQQIRGQGGHIGFRIDLESNNTWLGPHKEHLW